MTASLPGATAVERAFDIPAVAWRRPIGLPCPDVPHPRVAPMIDDGEWAGVPLGGIGTGSIGPTFRGDVARWHLEVGRHRFEPTAACGWWVIVREAGGETRAWGLATHRDGLPAWAPPLPVGAGAYHALVPRAWWTYDPAVLGVELEVEQLSPLIAGDLEASALPVGTFQWRLRNPGPAPLSVTLVHAWTEPPGAVPDGATPGARRIVRDGDTLAVELGAADGAPTWRDGTIALAVAGDPAWRLSARTGIHPTADVDAWREVSAGGSFGGTGVDADEPAVAIAATVELPPGGEASLTSALAWDLPTVEFGLGRRWRKRYARTWGASGTRAVELARHALARRPAWRSAIEAWQRPVLEAPDRPDWYKAALFNELYIVVDGGSVLVDGDDGTPHFALLECVDYPFYATVDVNITASVAILRCWPELERWTVRDVAAAVATERPEVVTIEATGRPGVRKLAGRVPHDLGGPDEDPFVLANRYVFQEVNGWLDLGPKLILQAWRDRVRLDDPSILDEVGPLVVPLLEAIAAADRDGDGLPEHGEAPDQTYDTWPLRGPGAYVGGLLLAALAAAAAIARERGEAALAARWEAWSERARASYEARLWAGTHYRLDGSDRPGADTVMSDQLAGQAFADALGLGDLLAPERVRTALRTIHARNVLDFGDGLLGAVNGMRPDGTVDRSSEQSEEVWVGTTYALAAHLLERGLDAEAWETAGGAARVTYERGLWFRTPEAYDREGGYRASIYLRPLAIWTIEDALERRATRGGPLG